MEDEETPASGFFVGTGARVFRPNREWKADSLSARAAAGARFLQTQLCFNLDILRQYMAAMVEARLTWRYSVIVSLAVLPSAVTAQWVKKNMSDSRIPKYIIERLEKAADPEQEGIRVCAELMQEIAAIPGVSGINLMTTGDAAAIPAAIEATGLRNTARRNASKSSSRCGPWSSGGRACRSGRWKTTSAWRPRRVTTACASIPRCTRSRTAVS
jgi:5,10-methylenetetrahydrofolate reductase